MYWSEKKVLLYTVQWKKMNKNQEKSSKYTFQILHIYWAELNTNKKPKNCIKFATFLKKPIIPTPFCPLDHIHKFN